MHNAISTRVHAKYAYDKSTVMSIKLFGFSTFYVFLDFWEKKARKVWLKTNVKTFKENTNKQTQTFKSS